MSTSRGKGAAKAQERAARAAAELAARQRQERRRNMLIALLVGVVMVVIVTAGFLASRLGDDSGDIAVDPGTGSGGTVASVAIGPEDAPHQIVVYEDFLCPFCRELEARTRDDLQTLADQGKVRVEYRPFQLFTKVEYSAQALEVFSGVLLQGDQAVAKAVHDALYDEQPPESGPFPSQDDIVDLAVGAGADEDALRAALDDGSAQDLAEQATHEATDAGVRGTPTVLLDGEVFQDGRTIDDIADNLVAAVSG